MLCVQVLRVNKYVMCASTKGYTSVCESGRQKMGFCICKGKNLHLLTKEMQ